jgi:hypothetical protein
MFSRISRALHLVPQVSHQYQLSTQWLYVMSLSDIFAGHSIMALTTLTEF